MIMTVTAMDISETTDTHQVHHVELDSEYTSTVTVVTVAITVEYMDTWTVVTTDMDIHTVVTTMVVIVEATCTPIVVPTLEDHATLTLTAHAVDMDMDTHAEVMIMAVTAMDISETMDTHQVHHVVLDSEYTSTVTVVTVAITVEYMDTWIAIVTDMDIHAVVTTMVVTVVVTCTLIVVPTLEVHATLTL